MNQETTRPLCFRVAKSCALFYSLLKFFWLFGGNRVAGTKTLEADWWQRHSGLHS
uniref:Uncharacterized protein n=1 Tax=Arundo donax TaxID=35708 RepID=A0A0A9FT28_ARUDO